jgi:hypothetical protein
MQETQTLRANCCGCGADLPGNSGNFEVYGEHADSEVIIRPVLNELIVFKHGPFEPSDFGIFQSYLIVRCKKCYRYTFHIRRWGTEEWESIAPIDWRSKIAWRWPQDMQSQERTFRNLQHVSYSRTIAGRFKNMIKSGYFQKRAVTEKIGFCPPTGEAKKTLEDNIANLLVCYAEFSGESFFRLWDHLLLTIPKDLPGIVAELRQELDARKQELKEFEIKYNDFYETMYGAIEDLMRLKGSIRSQSLADIRAKLSAALTKVGLNTPQIVS